MTTTTLIALSLLMLTAFAGAQNTISLNPNYRSEWTLTPHFSSMGIEFLNHEVCVLL